MVNEITERRNRLEWMLRRQFGESVSLSYPQDRLGRGSKTVPSASRLVVESADPAVLNAVRLMNVGYIDTMNDTTIVVRF